MITDPSIREQAYQYFLEEAPVLLETIEQELFSLKNSSFDRKERSLKVNNLMRAAHTLKGGAANVGLETIKTISHSFEDILKALYNPDLEIDSEIQVLLFESYECLRLPLTAELTKASINHDEVLERANHVFAQLREKLAEYITDRDAFPSSEELGIDVVASFFEVVIPERLQELINVVATENVSQVADTLASQSEVFVGLAESLNLPGFGEIAQTALEALQVNPQATIKIAEAAIANIQQAKQQILEQGDRVRGGEPSAALKQLASLNAEVTVATTNSTDILDSIWGEEEETISSPVTTPEVIPDLNVEFEIPEIENTTIVDSQVIAEVLPQEEEIIPELVEKQKVESSKSIQVETQPSQQTKVTEKQETIVSESKVISNQSEKQTSKKNLSQTVRVNLNSLEKLNDLVGEILINQNQNFLKHEQIDDIIHTLTTNLKQGEQIINQVIEILEDKYITNNPTFVRQIGASPEKSAGYSEDRSSYHTALKSKNIESEKEVLDELNLKESLKSILSNISASIQETESVKSFNQQSGLNLHKQQRMLLNMRDELIDTRMSPIAKVFNRFPYLIEQLTSTHDKKIDLKLVGSHILIDKAIEDKLYDPLLHLVRNSFDHGIETPENRSRVGKSETGKIELRAYYQGSQTIIEVKDDGQGLNIEKIRNRAIEKNLITTNQAKKIPESKLLEFLFESGFSTASQVTDLSGRGVGLDVVRTQVQAMKGTIDIESNPGEGTTFSLKIPLTLSIAKLMLCQAEGITYALLIDSIEKILIPTSSQIRVFEGEKILTWETENGKQIIPIRVLSDLMEYTRTAKRKKKKLSDQDELIFHPILLIRRSSGLIGLEIDRVIGEQELVIRPLGSAIAPPSYVYGCSILSNSRLTLVIDAAALVKESQSRAVYENKSTYIANTSSQQALISQDADSQKLLPAASVLPTTLLVVDDSSSLRKTISMSLQKVSQQVLEAENGLEGIEQLQEAKNVDLVVCDLEMPHMNGFQFLQAVRQNPQFADIPIVILTTRDSEKHRRLALDLGAAAYLIKPYEEEKFLSTILELVDRKNR